MNRYIGLRTARFCTIRRKYVLCILLYMRIDSKVTTTDLNTAHYCIARSVAYLKYTKWERVEMTGYTADRIL